MAGDKLSKVSHMHTLLNNQLIQYGVFSELLSIDESIILYYERKSGKIVTRGKLIRFGYNLWYACDSNGYLLSGPRGSCLLYSSIPLGTRVVNSRMHVIRTIQMLLNTSCSFITGLKFIVIDFSSMSIYESSWNSHGNRITHATQNMKTTMSWKRVDGGHVITHLMNLSMWQNRIITQLSMYAAISPLIHHATRANVESHNRNLYQYTVIGNGW